jgi:hypothetical protein
MRKKRMADEAFAIELRVALNQRHDEERIRALKSKNNQPISEKEKAWRKERVERARALATAQGRTKATFSDFSAFYREGPPQRNSDKYVQQGIADGICYLLQKWPGVNGLGNISVCKIGMQAMQIMLDMMMDLMNTIAREAAMIPVKEGRRTLSFHDIATAASLILLDGKDAHSCTTMLEMNIKA